MSLTSGDHARLMTVRSTVRALIGEREPLVQATDGEIVVTVPVVEGHEVLAVTTLERIGARTDRWGDASPTGGPRPAQQLRRKLEQPPNQGPVVSAVETDHLDRPHHPPGRARHPRRGDPLRGR
ncbi:hypothetical protein GCM10010464_32320 [Pseudonocardia yunnanensis]